MWGFGYVVWMCLVFFGDCWCDWCDVVYCCLLLGECEVDVHDEVVV